MFTFEIMDKIYEIIINHGRIYLVSHIEAGSLADWVKSYSCQDITIYVGLVMLALFFIAWLIISFINGRYDEIDESDSIVYCDAAILEPEKD